ncbi:GMC oxidoreductase [Laetiporus sulphureus 93-53]|uniref:GMC oxidoreductase n=1 Tax=Laetiporus sulphureus 93-53 TaxID=1314785 RepID=A0A165FB18_9APHY|nr:GMC oxidoreductase [Laetiporus sulphureus 93-53]KZT08694.1 GMC oxidoreductase [Laetiporus sulphureus 93-53]
MWPFTSSYPEWSLQSVWTVYDYIVVGGGNAGCVLARRLSEDAKRTVLLVERGDARDSCLDVNPLLSIHHSSDQKHSVVIESAVDPRFGRSFPLVVGTGLGGATRINGNQYTCGVPAQYNLWSQQGRKGWSYKDIKPYFDKSERWNGPVPREYHGLDGPLEVTSFEEFQFGSSRRAAEAAQKIGFLDILDMHSPLEPSVGCNKMQFTIDSTGRRHSAFRAYLPQEVVDHRPNLHICTNTIACKIVFSEADDGVVRAVGVDLQAVRGGPKRAITARKEIVLSCGALGTPQLLLLSGVGPEDHLREMGIHIVKSSPGVGQHLQDHLIIQTMYNCPLPDSLWAMVRRPTTLLRELINYYIYGTGWFLCRFAEMEVFGMSSLVSNDGLSSPLAKEHLDSFDPENLPDFAVLPSPIADYTKHPVDKSKGIWGLHAALLLPRSSGRLTLHSLDPKALPHCDMRYLSAPEDYAALRAALRVSLAITREMRASGYPLDAVQVPDVTSNTALDEFIEGNVNTMFHYASTCRMAPEDDAQPGVVDDELRVHGIRNLRIADASVFPDVPAAHPQALVYAMAERCADLIRQNDTFMASSS